MAAERGKRKVLRNQRSTYVRHVKRRMRNATDTALTHPHLLSIIEVFDEWPEASHLATMQIETLESHIEDAQACVQHWIRSLKHVLILLLNRQKTSRALYKRTNKNLHL